MNYETFINMKHNGNIYANDRPTVINNASGGNVLFHHRGTANHDLFRYVPYLPLVWWHPAFDGWWFSADNHLRVLQ